MTSAGPTHRMPAPVGSSFLTAVVVSWPLFAGSALCEETRPPAPLLASWHFMSLIELPTCRADYVVGVGANFTRLLSSLGVAEPFDRNSVRVVELSWQSKPLRELSCCFMPDAAFDAATHACGEVRWVVRKASFSAVTRRYQVYFDILANGPKSELPCAISEPNLIWNGSFEEDGDRNGQPDCWGDSWVPAIKTEFRGNVWEQGTGHRGQRCARLSQPEAGKTAYLAVPNEKGVDVDCGRRYLLSFWYRLQMQGKGSLDATVFWYASNGRRVGRGKLLHEGSSSADWQQGLFHLAPPESATGVVVFLTFCAEQKHSFALLDDFILVPEDRPSLTSAMALEAPAVSPDLSSTPGGG